MPVHLFITATCSPSPLHAPPLDHTNIWWAVKIIKILNVEFSPASFNFIPVRFKYSHRLRVLTHPECVLTKLTFVMLQKTKLLLRIYLHVQRGRQTILKRMAASTPWISSVLTVSVNVNLISFADSENGEHSSVRFTPACCTKPRGITAQKTIFYQHADLLLLS